MEQRQEEFVPGRGVVEINRRSVRADKKKSLSVIFKEKSHLSLFTPGAKQEKCFTQKVKSSSVITEEYPFFISQILNTLGRYQYFFF